MNKMNNKYGNLVEILRQSKKAIALTGAGISTESGIPMFRGSQGLWSRYDPFEYAHIESFMKNPGKVWKMLKELDDLIRGARPNPAHFALAKMESLIEFKTIITQNVDNLHQAAGSTRVIEFHGNGRRLLCMDCGKTYQRTEVSLESLPPYCLCGGVLKPDIVFFGEPIPWKASMDAAHESETCDVLLVIGTSAVIAPASLIPITAKRHGAKVVELNPVPTDLTGTIADLSLHHSAADVLPEVVSTLENLS